MAKVEEKREDTGLTPTERKQLMKDQMQMLSIYKLWLNSDDQEIVESTVDFLQAMKKKIGLMVR